MSRATLLVALLLVALVVVLVFLPKGKDPGSEATIAETIAVYGYDDDGAPLWEIRARSGRITGSDQRLDDVAIDFFDAESSTLSLRGDHLERSESTSRLSGGVRIERDDDLLLTTEALTWDEADEQLESGPVELSTEDLRVSAAAFGYDLHSSTAQFTGGVEASVALDTSWTIVADRAEEHDGRVTFQQDVVAESEDDQSFAAERLEVDPEAETVRLSGGVVGEWASGRLSAETVELDSEGIRAAGGVTARLDLEEMRGSNDP